MVGMAVSSEVWTALVVVGVTLLAAILVPLVKTVKTFLWEPLRLRRIMAKQGVMGPPFRLFFGNSSQFFDYAQSFPESLPLAFDDYAPTVTPQYDMYFKLGNRFMYLVGPELRLVLREPEMVKEVLLDKSGAFERSPMDLYVFTHVIGNGLFSREGEEWAVHRRTLNPFFYQDSLQSMVGLMVKGATEEIAKWEQLTKDAGGIMEHDVDNDIHVLSGKIISYTAFGDEDYEKGKQIYELQDETMRNLFLALGSPNFWIPGFRFLPTKEKKAMAQLDDKIERVVMEVVEARKKAVQKGERISYGKDMLGLMLAECERTDESCKSFDASAVFNNCKNFFFAGQDTSANFMTYILLMLANHPEWQDRARKEILEVLGEEETYNFYDLARLKVMGMILNEVARTFTVSPSAARVAAKDTQIGDLFIPKGLAIEIAILAMHRDPEFWGEDAAEFNPERFANGVSQACKNINAFIPFGNGSRRCIAEKMAILETKIVVAMILRRFQLLPSPQYKHHPIFAMVSRPKFGLPLILKSLNQ